jgi:hypothetical protein
MGNIKGIRVDLGTASFFWSPTKDKLFIGVYGEAGGREFRLNGDFQINQTNHAYKLALGTICCDAPGYHQVQYSTNNGDNNPSLNPIDLASVRYVYLRKETDDSTIVNDDELTLASAKILLCDADGNNRRFFKRGKLCFSDEAGLQHWIGEIDPPGCTITVTLKRIRHHIPPHYKAAGAKWHFDFGAGPSQSDTNILNDLYLHEPKKDWVEEINASTSWFVAGCCGHPQQITIHGAARETDLFKDDVDDAGGTWTTACGTTSSTQSEELKFSVEGNIGKRKSEFTFEFDVTSICND